MRKRLLSYLVVSLVSSALAASFQPLTLLQSQAQGRCLSFRETGKSVCGRFLQYWQAHGGIAQQGYPISGEFREISALNGKEYTVQYFERAVFEFHPENQAPYDVLLSQLGTLAFKQKYPGGDPSALTPTPHPTTTITSASPTPIVGATIRAFDARSWQPSSVGIAPGVAVTWENYDVAGPHPVECVQSGSSAACPWLSAKPLPAAQRDAAGNVIPASTTILFQYPGVFAFRSELQPDMTGKVIVGAPPPPHP